MGLLSCNEYIFDIDMGAADGNGESILSIFSTSSESAKVFEVITKCLDVV